MEKWGVCRSDVEDQMGALMVAGRGRLEDIEGTPHDGRRGMLRNANPSGDYSKAARWGAKTRRGSRCQCPAMKNGRCGLHGGLSTGPRTAAKRVSRKHIPMPAMTADVLCALARQSWHRPSGVLRTRSRLVAAPRSCSGARKTRCG